MSMKWWTIIGMYEDGSDSFVQTSLAASAKEAAAQFPNVEVIGVIEGSHTVYSPADDCEVGL